MTLTDVIGAEVVRPVVVGLLDFEGDPAYGWTGNGVLAVSGSGDPDLDGNLYVPAEGAIDVTEFVTDMANGRGVTLTFAAPDTDAEIIKQVVRDNRAWQLRKMKLWLGFYKEGEAELHPWFRQVFGGVMIKARTSRQPGAPGQIKIDGDTDYALASGPAARVIDHGEMNPGDNLTSWMLDLLNGAIASAGGASGGAARSIGHVQHTKGYGAPKSKWTYNP
jgi:hypothetical protein